MDARVAPWEAWVAPWEACVPPWEAGLLYLEVECAVEGRRLGVDCLVVVGCAEAGRRKGERCTRSAVEERM